MIGRRESRHVLAAMIALVAALVLLSSQARAQQCIVPRNLPPLTIQVQVVQPQIAYHHDVDLFGLQKLGNAAERPPSGMIRLGTTFLSDSFRAQYRYAAVPTSSGYCVWLAQVAALLGNEVMNVYVADEYPPDSCEYKVILAHENTHVRFNVETLRDWAPTIRAALIEAAKRKFPAIFPSKPTEDDINRHLLTNMDDVFGLMNQDMAKRNATIDTPENYARENAKCGNWSRHNFHMDRPRPAAVPNASASMGAPPAAPNPPSNGE